MSTCIVLLHDEETGGDEFANGQVRSRIQDYFPQNYKLSSHAYLVHSPMFVREVAERLGLDTETQHLGAVISLNGSYSGFTSTRLWDWLREAEPSL